ncbi:MAG: transcriptional regulator, MarR family [Sphaerisporangium sp.]|nr:transcriptional regulator, MarR family [Sphaerisporangium sp.]
MHASGDYTIADLAELFTVSRPTVYRTLKRSISGISEKMLIQQLREMETYGLVHREVYHQVPPRVDYSLTEFGHSLNTALIPLGDWGEKHMQTIEALPRD